MAADQVPKIIHPNGCLSELKEVIEGNVAALGGVGVGIAVIQVIKFLHYTLSDFTQNMAVFAPLFATNLTSHF